MAKTIVWNRRASDSFNAIVIYLKSNWNERVTRDFVNRTYHILELLSLNPEMGSLEHEEKQIRGFVITKHNTLFYRVDDTRLILLHFFDNRQDPKKKPF